MDEYDELLKEINKEERARKEKRFWRGKKWTEEQIKKMSAIDRSKLKINRIKSGQEIQREHMREQMGLTDTEGLTITEENVKKLIFDLTNSIPCCGGILSNDVFYEDFSHFASALIKKYFTKVV